MAVINKEVSLSPPEAAAECISYLQEALKQVPASERGGAKIVLYEDEGYSTLQLHYKHTETQDEVTVERLRVSKYRQECEARDRQTFERLKAKFEGGGQPKPGSTSSGPMDEL